MNILDEIFNTFTDNAKLQIKINQAVTSFSFPKAVLDMMLILTSAEYSCPMENFKLIPRFIFSFDLNQVSCISTLTVDINVAPIIRILTSFKKDHLNAEVQIKKFSGYKTSKGAVRYTEITITLPAKE